jgi:hypothetical protein
VETKEYVAGFWIIEALDVALRLATLGSKHCNRRVELRPVPERMTDGDNGIGTREVLPSVPGWSNLRVRCPMTWHITSVGQPLCRFEES